MFSFRFRDSGNPFGIPLLLVLVLFINNFFYGNTVFGQSKGIDKSTLEELTEDRTEDGTDFNLFLSHSNNYVCLGVPFSLFVVGAIRHDADIKQNAMYVSESILMSAMVTTALKYTIRRQRPFVNDPNIIPKDKAGSYSFPSGHASEAFSTATSLVIAYPKWYVIAPAYLWAGSVSYSRMYLGVHYPSDILAGAVTGAGSAWLSYKLNKWMHRKIL